MNHGKLESVEHARDIVKGSKIDGRTSYQLYSALDAVEREVADLGAAQHVTPTDDLKVATNIIEYISEQLGAIDEDHHALVMAYVEKQCQCFVELTISRAFNHALKRARDAS